MGVWLVPPGDGIARTSTGREGHKHDRESVRAPAVAGMGSEGVPRAEVPNKG